MPGLRPVLVGRRKGSLQPSVPLGCPPTRQSPPTWPQRAPVGLDPAVGDGRGKEEKINAFLPLHTFPETEQPL